MQIEILTVNRDECAPGKPCTLCVKNVILDADADAGGFRRLEMSSEGGQIVEVAAQCDGGMVVVRLSEHELRQMAKLVRADDIPPAI